MRLTPPLVRLPSRLDVVPLRAEIAGLEPEVWIPCSNSALGDSALPLVSPGGAASHDFSLAGPARETAILARCPALRSALAELGVPIARSRLIRAPGGFAPASSTEWNYHWFRRTPICIPITAHPAVTFHCGGTSTQLSAGEAWRYDNASAHRLVNESDTSCVQLIVETRDPEYASGAQATSPLLEPYRFEVLTPAEFSSLAAELLDGEPLRGLPEAARLTLRRELMDLQQGWESAFAEFGHDSRGELAYQDLLLRFRETVLPVLVQSAAPLRAATVIDTMLYMSPPTPKRLHRPLAQKSGSASAPSFCARFERPLFIVSAPRAGSTLLFDLIARFPDVYTIGGESHAIIRGLPTLHPSARAYASDRLTAADASPAVTAALMDGFSRQLIDRRGQPLIDLPAPSRPSGVRFLEKTPANALRIPFLRAVFPEARFIYLRREAKENISSLVEGWRSRRFLSYRGMPGWPYRDWSFFLPPGWQSLAGRSLVEIAAYQWQVANATIEADLGELPASEWCEVSYAELLQQPRDVASRIGQFAGLTWDDEMERTVSNPLPVSRVTLSAPSPDKWLRHEREIAAALAR